jgi:hypothetical protein
MSETIRKAADPDAPITTNEKGGGQSHIPVRFDLIDAKAMFEVAAVLHEGAEKYGADNWRLIDIEDHLNHLLTHVYAYLAGDRSDDHLSHAACRAIFALADKLEREHGVDDWVAEPLLVDVCPVEVGSLWYDRDGNWEITVERLRERHDQILVEWIAGTLELSDFLYEFYQPPEYGSVWRNKDTGYQVMVSGHEVEDQQLATIYTLNELFTADDFFERYEEVKNEVEEEDNDLTTWLSNEMRKRLDERLWSEKGMARGVEEPKRAVPEVGSYWTSIKTGRVTKVTNVVYDAWGDPIIFEATSYEIGDAQWELDEFYHVFEPNGA